MTTYMVCSKCGRTAEIDDARRAGWLVAQMKDAPQGHLIIRCPNCTTEYARRLAGLPQQVRMRRVEQNIDVGLWVEYGHPADDYSASVGEEWDREEGRRFYLSYHKGRMPAFDTEWFETVEALVAAMREVEPDLRKWKVRKDA